MSFAGSEADRPGANEADLEPSALSDAAHGLSHVPLKVALISLAVAVLLPHIPLDPGALWAPMLGAAVIIAGVSGAFALRGYSVPAKLIPVFLVLELTCVSLTVASEGDEGLVGVAGVLAFGIIALIFIAVALTMTLGDRRKNERPILLLLLALALVAPMFGFLAVAANTASATY